jgi:ABC-type bacteriocin/lantibiotic exporter with double-glycine peptidase domain
MSDSPQGDTRRLSRFQISAPWRYYGEKYRGQLWETLASAVLAVLAFLFVIPSVAIVRMVFDRALPQSNFHLLVWAGVGLVVLNLAAGGLSLLTRSIALKTTKQVTCHIRADLLTKMYAISRRYFSETESSLLHSRIVHDSERVDLMTNTILSGILPSAVCSIAVSLILLKLNWKLYLSLCCIGPVLLFINRRFASKVRRNVKQYYDSFHTFSHGIMFLLRTIDLVRVQNTKDLEIERQMERVEYLRDASGEMVWLQAAYNVTQQNMTTALVAIMLVVGGWAVASHTMSMGSLMSFYFCLALLTSYLRDLLSSAPTIIAGHESLLEMHELLALDDLEPYQGTQRIGFQGSISFQDVQFGYRRDVLLQGIDLELPAGSKIALIGPNGSGKTTLLHLLCGFYRPHTGRLLADGHPYDEIDITELRESIGVVMQDPILFSGTIRENLVYGSPKANEDDVEWAARMATAHEFIVTLPLGYETVIGEHGVLLSGGQRQRIAIGRAILRRPRILLLDEPTNHLDRASVARVTANLHELPDAPTIIVVSHDRNVVEDFDAVYAINHGQLTLHTEGRVEAQQIS